MKRAHTLAELLVVLTILTLFAVIAVPRFTHRGVRARLDASFDALRSDIAFTRARAISSGLRHQLFLDTETLEVTVQPFRPETAEQQGTAAQIVPDPVLRDRLYEDVRVMEWNVAPLGYASGTQASAVVADQPLTFYPEGVGDSATIILQDSRGEQRGLTVDGFSGEVREMTEEELRQ